MSTVKELREFLETCRETTVSNDESEASHNYGKTINSIIEVDIDVSAKTFFNHPNKITNGDIKSYYTNVEVLLTRDAYWLHRSMIDNENDYKEVKQKVKDNKNNKKFKLDSTDKNILKKHDKDMSDLDKKIKMYKRIIASEQKKKLKEFERANKQISGFRSYHMLYKNLKFAKEMFYDENDKLKIDSPNFDFLEDTKYTNYAIRKELCTKEDCDKVDFAKKIKELTKIAEESFKKVGEKLTSYLPPNMPWWREVLCFFGKKNYDDARHNFNMTEYNYDGTKKSNENYKYGKWMGKLDNNTKLNQMVIPGAHDAGTYSMKPKSSTDLPGKMAYTQTGNFMGMLRSGIRYFDWRMRKVGETFVFYHGVVNGGNVLEAVKQIDKFLESNKKEIIIISLVANDACIRDFLKIKMVDNFFKKRVYKKTSSENIGTLSLDTIRAKNKNIIIINSSSVISDYGFAGGQITGTYNPKTRMINNTNVMLGAEVTYAQKANSQIKDSKLSAMSPIHTPGVKSVLSYLLGLKKGVHNIPAKEAHKNFNNNMNKLKDKLKNSETGKVEWTNFVRYDNVNDTNVKPFTKYLIKKNNKYLTNIEKIKKSNYYKQIIKNKNLNNINLDNTNIITTDDLMGIFLGAKEIKYKFSGDFLNKIKLIYKKKFGVDLTYEHFNNIMSDYNIKYEEIF